MHAERDYLIKRVFPRLRQWCQERRLHLVGIDLRWGVTKEQADNGAAINICLREIDGSRPFFVCILGNRYGWIPDKLPPEEMYSFEGLQAETRLSITHLEILHAAMKSIPTKTGKVESICQHAFFYFREPSCLPVPESLTAMSEDELKKYSETFFEQLPEREQMLKNLKDEIRSRYAAEDRVFDYTGSWDGEAANPEDELLKGRLTDLLAFGERVEADLINGIEERFAEHIAALGADDDPLAGERSNHDFFIENRTQVYVPRLDVDRLLNDYLDGDEHRLLVMSGPSGSGKSAMLAHWVSKNVNRDTWLAKSDNQTFVVPRFIGASAGSVNLHRLLANVCQELQQHFELTEVAEDVTGGEKTARHQRMEVPTDHAETQKKWPKFLEAAAQKGRVIIILDALDQLDRDADPMRFSWLPRELPQNVHILVSALEHGESSDPEYKTETNDPLDWLSVLRRMKLPEVRVPELTSDERRQMIQEIPIVFCKTLDESQISGLLNNKATSNPLFLFVALEELRVYGGFGKEGERLQQAIHGLPWLESNGVTSPAGAPIFTTIDEALDALFGQILDRLQRETDRQAENLSLTVFRLLASARDGLSEEELDAVLARVLPDVDEEARVGELQGVLRQVRPYLVRKGVLQRMSELDNPSDDYDETATADTITLEMRPLVLLDFFHRSFWKAVRAKYLEAEDAQAQSHRELAEYFQDEEQQPYFLETLERQRHRARRLPPTPRSGNVRKVLELPYHVLEVAKLIGKDDPQANEWDAVADLLTDWQFLEAKAEAAVIFDLVQDFSAAASAMPKDHPRRRILSLLEEAVRRDVHFIDRHPTTLFQCMWNTCWWYDCIESKRHYEVSGNGAATEPSPWRRRGPKLCNLMKTWRIVKERTIPGFVWLRSLRPPTEPLGSSGHHPFLGHQWDVSSVAWSSNGKFIASGSWDPTVRIWDASTGAAISCLSGHEGPITSVAITPDGNLVASGASDCVINIWDILTGALIAHFDDSQSVQKEDLEAIRSLTIPTHSEERVDPYLVHERQLGETVVAGRIRTFFPDEGFVTTVAWSPDGRRLASAPGDNTIRIWELATRKEQARFQGPASSSDQASAVAWSPTGTTIAVAWGGWHEGRWHNQPLRY